jgi:hypothetical protein
LVFRKSAYPLPNREYIFACISEINGDLSAEHERVRNPAGTAWPENILQIGLDVERAVEQSHAISQLQDRLVRLHSNIWIQLLRPTLKILQVIAKMTVHNAQADYISRTRWENATRNKGARKKIRHLTHGLIGRGQERAGDSETAMVNWFPEPNENLVKHPIKAPIPAVEPDRVEVSEETVVVPKAGLVIAD